MKNMAGGSVRQGGWAMMETLIALIIGLVVLAGAFILVQQSFSGNNVSQTREELMTISTNIKRLFTQQSNYAGLDSEIAAKARVVPESMIQDQDSGDIRNVWGGTVEFGTDNSALEYTITYNDVPQEACIELATYDRGEWVNISAEGTDVNYNDVGGATTACSGLDGNEMIFTGK